ncbi:hypothetical protein C5167_004719 [Papaver somniferum]|uniref:Proteasome alpha-type subunits domain-containing protein n=1 Tax=Papaver somniferum TaxID=3469 RepID=A0A4Y7J8E8_PAPSO|nr:hypothetical protein C5167_004719 [Papaver somniferum]
MQGILFFNLFKPQCFCFLSRETVIRSMIQRSLMDAFTYSLFLHYPIHRWGLNANEFLSKKRKLICRLYQHLPPRPCLPKGVVRGCFKCTNCEKVCTHRSWKRPYGVGMLVIGLDESGAHLYYNFPSGNYFEYQAFAIGARSQSAKTCLERKFESFANSTCDDLIKDALFVIKERS